MASRNLFVDSLLAGKLFFISVLILSCPCTAATKMENNYYQVSSSVFSTELLIWFFAEESAVKGFIDGCVYVTSCRLLRRTTGKIFYHFKFLTIRVPLLPPQMKYSCYQDSSVIQRWFVYLVFGLRIASTRNSTKVKVEHGDNNRRTRWTKMFYQISFSFCFFFSVVFITHNFQRGDPCNIQASLTDWWIRNKLKLSILIYWLTNSMNRRVLWLCLSQLSLLQWSSSSKWTGSMSSLIEVKWA